MSTKDIIWAAVLFAVAFISFGITLIGAIKFN